MGKAFFGYTLHKVWKTDLRTDLPTCANFKGDNNQRIGFVNKINDVYRSICLGLVEERK